MNSIFMRYPEGCDRALTLSYDDGVKSDKRLIEIMKKNGLKGTFNINCGCFAPESVVNTNGEEGRRMAGSEAASLYKDSGMEVALHGYNHLFWDTLPENVLSREILRDREQLEEIFDTIILGAAYPFGAYNDRALRALESCGVAYCRTTVSTLGFDIPKNWLTLNPTCHHNNPRLMELAHSFAESEITRKSTLFYLWGHSYEFPRDNNWQVIEEFAEFIGGRENIWYATNIEIYEYVTAFSRLIFSTDGSQVKNPTATRLWFCCGSKVFSVNPGECIKLK